jgi:hypothetical protein
MSYSRESSTSSAKLSSRRYFSKAVVSMASLTLAAGSFAALSAPAQAAVTPTTQVQPAAVQTQGHHHQKGCDVDAYKPHYQEHHGKKYASFPFKVKCYKGYIKVQVKQHYYAEDKHGNSHYHGNAHYQYSFGHHGGETWGGGQWHHFDHHYDKKVYHVVEYRYWDGHHWSHWYKDVSHKTHLGH